MMVTGIRHEANRFFKEINGIESHLEYQLINDATVVFYHTFVPDEFRGLGIAKELIKQGLDWAISENLEIIVTCSAVQRFIDRNIIYRDYIFNYEKFNASISQGSIELY